MNLSFDYFARITHAIVSSRIKIDHEPFRKLFVEYMVKNYQRLRPDVLNNLSKTCLFIGLDENEVRKLIPEEFSHTDIVDSKRRLPTS